MNLFVISILLSSVSHLSSNECQENGDERLLHILKIQEGDFKSSVRHVGFHPSGEFIATADWNLKVKFWSMKDYRLLLNINEETDSVAFDSSGKHFAAGHAGIIVIRDAKSGAQIKLLRVDSATSRAIRSKYFSRKEMLAATDTVEGVRVFDVKKGKSIKHFKSKGLEQVFDIHPKNDDLALLRGVFDAEESQLVHQIEIYDGKKLERKSKKYFKEKFPGWPLQIRYSSTGNLIGICGWDRKRKTGACYVYDTRKGKLIQKVADPDGLIRSMQFSRNESQLYTGHKTGKIVTWDLGTGKPLLRLEGHTAQVNSLDLHPTKPILASSSEDSTVRLWDIEASKERK